MTEQMIARLRRSPRRLLEKDGVPGPGPGSLSLVLARAGVGKTAFLVGIGLDALLAGQRVLHVTLDRTIDKVRDWYDDLLLELLRLEPEAPHPAEVQLAIERRRHIHTFLGNSFSTGRLRTAAEVLASHMDFRPDVLIVDRLELESVDPAEIRALRDLAAELGAELWMSCRTHREGPASRPGHLPPPADRVEDLVDLAFCLQPDGDTVRLDVIEDRGELLARQTRIVLDPHRLLLRPGA